MRKTLEHCEVDADIRLFVSMKQTGFERPGQTNFISSNSEKKSFKIKMNAFNPVKFFSWFLKVIILR